MNYLDLFSGIGGFALGAYWAGLRFERHYFSEIDPWCCALYQRRFPDAVPLGDIREIDGTALVSHAESNLWRASGYVGPISSYGPSTEWILTGGFPCQDISVAGKGAGIKGVRSGLWFEYARLIGEIRPRYAIMENVGALTRRGLDRVLGSLAEIGYDAQWSDIRASDVGAPHRRERIWIVAYPQSSGRRKRRQGRLACLDSRISERPLSNTIGAGLEGQRKITGRVGTQLDDVGNHCGWSVEPDVLRMAYELSHELDKDGRR